MRSDGIRAQAAAATRKTIVEKARTLFVAHGYQAVSIEQIVSQAGVTRGALYHHFGDKRALFLAVFKQVESELSARPVPPPPPAADQSDPWLRYRIRVQSFLDAILRAEVHRVLLIDGPMVLGWEEWRRQESAYGLGAISPVLLSAMEIGTITHQPVEPLARIVLAAILETALLIAVAEQPEKTRHVAGRALDQLLGGLTNPQGASSGKPPVAQDRASASA